MFDGFKTTLTSILAEVQAERARQDQKWGQQNHPDLSPAVYPPTRPELMDRANYLRIQLVTVARYYGLLPAAEARIHCDSEHKRGQGSWFSIHIEELAEAMEAAVLGDTVELRKELIQTMATLAAHVEHIDRRQQ